jgi:hypothetical protein
LRDEPFNATKTYEGLNHSDSNRHLMGRWLRGDERLSRLADHVATMQLTQLLCEAVAQPGRQVEAAFSI